MFHATKYALEALTDALRFELRGFGIHVVLIEPGLIRTGFGERATEALCDAVVDDDYRPLHDEVARLTRHAAERGMAARLAGTPDDVAVTIERALTVAKPRPRYRVSPSATLFIAQRRWLGDRAWDRFLSRVYPSPGAERKK